MKTRQYLTCIGTIIVFNIVIFLYFLILQNSKAVVELESRIDGLGLSTFEETVLSKQLTVVIRDYEDFENTLDLTINGLQNKIKALKIIVVGEGKPYPPIKTNFNDNNNVHFVSLKERADAQLPKDRVWNLISTPFVMLMPDGANLTSAYALTEMLNNLQTRKFIRVLSVQVGYDELTCPDMNINSRKWTMKIMPFDDSVGMCDYIAGEQAVLLRTDDLFELSSPFDRPMYISLYMQTSSRHWKSTVYRNSVFSPRKRFEDFHVEWKYKRLEEERMEDLMRKFSIKHVVYKNTIERTINHGCRKDTERCFGTVENNMPDFLYSGKWTPPCCLAAVRETAKYVFKLMEKAGVRYWLEGGSLLGAARNGDIIPWDYDVDIGIYKSDINKSDHLKKLLKQERFVDEHGFQWERATEGEFFRVHFSDVNRNHVDIFPFYPKNKIMTKNTWFKTHRQDTEFPEHYLQPLIKIEFIGRNVSAPNNVSDFLEFKFGKGVIDNPKYPNANLIDL